MTCDAPVSAGRRRLLAFYLPAFYPNPINDAAWGPGFTEWTNVARARPIARWHEQPRLPGELGFYDLRLGETRARQAELARAYGIEGFVYHHYWFDGVRPLSTVVDAVLAGGDPDVPFALCWANENWTRAWDGGSKQVILAQRYSTEDDVAHARWLAPALAHSRALSVDDRPLLLIHRASLLPDPHRTTDTWRAVLTSMGLPEPYLVRVESFPDEEGDPRPHGFDAAAEFPPAWRTLTGGRRSNRAFRAGVRHGLLPRRLGTHVASYQATARAVQERPPPPYLRFPGVTPAWDNTPRRTTGGVVLRGSSPDAYRTWLEHALRRPAGSLPGEDLVFVNAWNEWGEGAVLEPDLAHGRAYLDATLAARRRLMD